MLLQSWVQSLRLLLPKNLKLFLLVTLKGIGDTYKNRVPWIWLSSVLFIIIGQSVPLLVTTMSGCLLFVFLMARPSIVLKDGKYLASYVVRYSTLVIMASVALFMAAKLSNAPLLRYLAYLVGPLAPLTVFTVLFMLDAKDTISNLFGSMYRSALLVWYNAPIMILFYALWLVYIAFFGYAIDLVMTITIDLPFKQQVLSMIAIRLVYVVLWKIFSLVSTIPLVLMTNYYVKRVHDNFTLYE